ncbi:hypothetical protein VN0401_08030 [Helicobacter pylori]|nr:hypothetical protein VN0401_08030 [Helicobacter pylori]
MVSYSFINFGGGFGISAYCHAHKLACLAGMIYFVAMALLQILALSQPQCGGGLYQK